VKVHKPLFPALQAQPLFHQPATIEGHPANFHIKIERFPGPDPSNPPAMVTFTTGPWGEDSGSSSGSSESSEEQGDNHFFNGK